MLIITADDYGKTKQATDSIFLCFSNKRITSVSAMVFMEDSERAASMALSTNLELGLHLNFTLPFSARKLPANLRKHQNRVITYLEKHKLFQLIYNPFLRDSFSFVFMSQQEEFMRLYDRAPDFFNGHHHMHLCANVLVSGMLPDSARVRRTFSFDPGEKNPFNRYYRLILNSCFFKRFISTDCFFSLAPVNNYKRIQNIINRAITENVEIELHPENADEIEFLLSDKFQSIISSIDLGCFLHLPNQQFSRR